MEAELAAGGSPARSAPPPKDKPLLFDLVFDEAQRPTAVPNSMISGRESKNPDAVLVGEEIRPDAHELDGLWVRHRAGAAREAAIRAHARLGGDGVPPVRHSNHAKHHRVHQATQVKREGDECGRSAAAAVAGAEGEASEIVAKRPKSVCAPRASESTRVRSRPTSARVASGWRMTSGENRTMNDTLALA